MWCNLNHCRFRCRLEISSSWLLFCWMKLLAIGKLLRHQMAATSPILPESGCNSFLPCIPNIYLFFLHSICFFFRYCSNALQLYRAHWNLHYFYALILLFILCLHRYALGYINSILQSHRKHMRPVALSN